MVLGVALGARGPRSRRGLRPRWLRRRFGRPPDRAGHPAPGLAGPGRAGQRRHGRAHRRGHHRGGGGRQRQLRAPGRVHPRAGPERRLRRPHPHLRGSGREAGGGQDRQPGPHPHRRHRPVGPVAEPVHQRLPDHRHAVGAIHLPRRRGPLAHQGARRRQHRRSPCGSPSSRSSSGSGSVGRSWPSARCSRSSPAVAATPSTRSRPRSRAPGRARRPRTRVDADADARDPEEVPA